MNCNQCGMAVTGNEYHPYAACLMYRACQNASVVRENLKAVRNAPFSERRSWRKDAHPPRTLADAIEEIGWMREDWQKLGEALGHEHHAGPDVLIEEAKAYHDALHYVFGKMPVESWRKVVDQKMTPPWPLPEHKAAMFATHSAVKDALDGLRSVLCDPNGEVCITGSASDQETIQGALKILAWHAGDGVWPVFDFEKQSASSDELRQMVAKLAAHVRPTCGELWAEAERLLNRTDQEMSDETEWVLVPREPSVGMWESAENAMIESECAYDAGEQAARSDAHGFPTMRIWQAVVGYRAMLAAAPQPPAEAQAQGIGGASVLRTAAEYHYAQAACQRVQSGNTSSHRNPRLEAWHRQVADAIASVTAPPSASVRVEALRDLRDRVIPAALRYHASGNGYIEEAQEIVNRALAQQPAAVDQATARRILTQFLADDPGDVWPPGRQGDLRAKALQNAINSALAGQQGDE